MIELRPYQREAVDLPKTPVEAKAAGSKYYFTGIACKRGHVAPRQTSNAVCAECRSLTFKRFYDKNPEAMRERANAAHLQRKDDPDFRSRKAGVSKDWYEANKDRARENNRRKKERLRLGRHYDAFMSQLSVEEAEGSS